LLVILTYLPPKHIMVEPITGRMNKNQTES